MNTEAFFRWKPVSISLMLGLSCFISSTKAALSVTEERIWLSAKINGKPVRLCLDTGASISALCPGAVQRLGLKFIPAPTNEFSQGVLAGNTDQCTLTLEGAEEKARFPVLDLPPYVSADFDGLIGWGTIKDNIVQIDAAAGKITFLPKAPGPNTPWARIVSITNSGTLELQVPRSERTNGVICVDTGSGGGLALPEREWRRWREAHPKSQITLNTIFTPSDGFYVREEAWADQISVGPMVLTDVPIAQARPADATRLGAQYEGTLELSALKRLDLIVDGHNGLAYVRVRRARPPRYSHNRLGAVFVPTAAHTNQAVARVVDGGPAYQAGVRTGDVLLQVGEVEVTGWSESWLSLFSMKAGTKLKLRLDRGGTDFNTTATLREILTPSKHK